MGDWNITIRGTGAHHNADYPKDANKMAARFVEQLALAGHQIKAASFTSGAEQVLAGGFEYAAEVPKSETTAGQRAFDAYRTQRGGKNHDGTPTPTWPELTDGVREGWEAAAAAVLG
jgi:hypothetical protein